MNFEPTRTAGQERLSHFAPRVGRQYSTSRNYDDGAPDSGHRQNVSQLSPWLHAGLISEAEVISTVLTNHTPAAADKFIAEVFWRIYFKGYLEQRPTIWTSFCAGRESALTKLGQNAGLRTAYEEAIEGRTGIGAFDHWARELQQTGYLHNHARMWFASIWIFTLKIDWHLGADFFLAHLADGDAASNTLSWRWVAGLHTKGKTYLARPDNIARYTANQPGGPLTAEELADEAIALEEPEDHGRRPMRLPDIDDNTFDKPYALLLHDEAASHIPLHLPTAPSLVIGAARPEARSPGSVSASACKFAHGSVENGLSDAMASLGCDGQLLRPGDSMMDLLRDAGVERIATPYLPVGWTRDALMPQLAPVIDDGRVTELLGDLNRATWPHAKAGFFGVKKKVEAILGETGIA